MSAPSAGTPPEPADAPSPDALDAAVDALSERLRALPDSSLRRGAAARALELAGELARRAQALEGVPAGEIRLPGAGIHAVGDQVAVTGHDLAEALRQAPPGPHTRRLLAEAVALVGAQRP